MSDQPSSNKRFELPEPVSVDNRLYLVTLAAERWDEVKREIERLAAEVEWLHGPSAPIAWIEISNGEIVASGQYAPGLPDGRHDLYPAANCMPLRK